MNKPDYRFIEGQLIHYFVLWRSSKSGRDRQLVEAIKVTMIKGLGYSIIDIEEVLKINLPGLTDLEKQYINSSLL